MAVAKSGLKVVPSIYENCAAEITAPDDTSHYGCRGVAVVYEHEDALAYANLFAAAPRLLAELERLIEECVDQGCDLPYATLRRARAAIAEAKGERS